MLYHSQGNLEKAATLYREVLNSQTNFAEARLNLGNILFALGDIEQSKESWRIALQERPDLASNFLGCSH